MSLNTRLIYTNLPKSHALFHLFEAVVNSIHSIDEIIKLDMEIESNINDQLLVRQLPWGYKVVLNSVKERNRAFWGKRRIIEKMPEEVYS